MNNAFFEKMMARQFKRADGIVWDMTNGRLGVETEDGIATIVIDGEDHCIEINPISQMSFELPAFAQATNPDDVKVGDLIYFGTKADKPGWVIERKEKKAQNGKTTTTFKLMHTTGTTSPWTPPKVQMLGAGDNGVMVVRALGSMLPNGEAGVGDMQNNLFMMMQLQSAMSGGQTMDMEQLMPIMLMGQVTGQGNNLMQAMMQMQFMQAMLGDGKKGGRLGFQRG